jgi:glyoxylase-like metal-dependent hydrolase (beta-lactamase superfamily II)
MSNARVCIHQNDALGISSGLKERKKAYEKIIAESGAPKDTVGTISKYYEWLFSLAEPVHTPTILHDKDIIELENFKLEVLHCPGHTAGSIGIYLKEREILFSGDLLIADTASTIGIYTDEKFYHKASSLFDHLNSLKKIEGLNLKMVLPAHGNIIYDYRIRIENILAHYEKRKERLMKILENNPKTPYEISKTIHTGRSSFQIFLSILEIWATLELLELENKVKQFRRGKVIYYRLA